MYSRFVIVGLLFLNIFASGLEKPCDIIDSIRINDGVLQPNKSIILNGIEYPEDQYMKEGNELRGCICNIGKCIRLCCPHGTFTAKMQFEEVQCSQSNAARNFQINLRDENGQIKSGDMDQNFGYVDRIIGCWYYWPDSENFEITPVSIGDIIRHYLKYTDFFSSKSALKKF